MSASFLKSGSLIGPPPGECETETRSLYQDKTIHPMSQREVESLLWHPPVAARVECIERLIKATPEEINANDKYEDNVNP